MTKERPLYVCRRTVGPIEIDGRLDEPSWAVAGPMALLDTVTGEAPKQSTEVRAMWDDECLYVGFHSLDTDAWATMTRREDPLWDEEVVEVFVDADGDGIGYAEYEINPLGTLMDIFVLNRGGHVRILYDQEPEAIRHATRWGRRSRLFYPTARRATGGSEPTAASARRATPGFW